MAIRGDLILAVEVFLISFTTSSLLMMTFGFLERYVKKLIDRINIEFASGLLGFFYLVFVLTEVFSSWCILYKGLALYGEKIIGWCCFGYLLAAFLISPVGMFASLFTLSYFSMTIKIFWIHLGERIGNRLLGDYPSMFDW